MSVILGKLIFLNKLRSTCIGYYQEAQAAGSNFNKNVQILRMDPATTDPDQRKKAAQEVEKALLYAGGAVASALMLSFIAVKVSAVASAIATCIVCYSSRSKITIQDLLAELKRLTASKVEAENSIRLLNDRISELLKQVEDEKQTNIELNKKVEDLEQANKTIPEAVDTNFRYEELLKKQNEEITRQNKEILTLKDKIQTRDETITEMTKTIEDLNLRIQELEAQLNSLETRLNKQETSLHVALRLHSFAGQTLLPPRASAQQIEWNLQNERLGAKSPTSTPTGPSQERLKIENLITDNQKLMKSINEFRTIKQRHEDIIEKLALQVKSLKENILTLNKKLLTYEPKSHI